MTARSSTQLKILAAVTLVAATVGAAYAPILARFEFFDVTPLILLTFALQGAIIGVLVGGFEVFHSEVESAEWFRRAPFVVTLLTKTVITTALLALAFVIGAVFLFPGRFGEEHMIRNFSRDIAFSFAVVLVIQFFLAVRQAIGGRVLANIVTGRYHQPFREDRVFLFLDLADSTQLAAQLGDIQAQALITRFFFDVAQVTIPFGGETHRYIGDEVVVTWPLQDGVRDASCLRCCFAIRDRIKGRAQSYRKAFGWAPEFRIGLHGGSVVAAECGDDKHEIVYFGDTVNTAARIVQYAKTVGAGLLVSGDLLGIMPLPQRLNKKLIDCVTLHGRTRKIELYTVTLSDPAQPVGASLSRAME